MRTMVARTHGWAGPRTWSTLGAAVVVGALLTAAPAVADPGSTAVNNVAVTAPAGQHAHLFRQMPANRPGIGQTFPATTPTPLLYKTGGIVIAAASHTHVIFWEPPHLQDGRAVAVSAGYNSLLTRFLADVGGHSLYNNDTQYYETLGTTTSFIQNASVPSGSVVDTSAYPKADCHDPAYPAADCISDAKIRAEITKEAAAEKWPTGLPNIYYVFTTTGEGSCQAAGDSTAADCFAPGGYCAYHDYDLTGTTVGSAYIYANMPYDGDAATGCGLLGAGGRPVSPNGNVAADVEIGVATHETMESVTDPFPGSSAWGWHDSSGAEIGDKCAGNPGPGPYWDNGLATEMWNGHFYAIQSMFDDHVLGCVQVGP